MTKLNRWEQSIYNSGLIAQQAESAAKIAELERRCLIAERAFTETLGQPHTTNSIFRLGKETQDQWRIRSLKVAEDMLIAEGKLPQIEVKNG